jgi:hypothetical protein
MMNEIQTVLETLNEDIPLFREKMAQEEKQSEEFWNSLSKEQQVQAFCAVMRRLYKGEIEENRTYRGMLYDVFEFGPESYVVAQISGFLTIHNCIWTGSEEIKKEVVRKLKEKSVSKYSDKYSDIVSDGGMDPRYR